MSREALSGGIYFYPGLGVSVGCARGKTFLDTMAFSAMAKDTDTKDLEIFLADEPYFPELAEEDYSAAQAVELIRSGNVNISFEMFKSRVDQAFRKRMDKVLSPKEISECINTPVYQRCVANKFKEVEKDNNNQNLSPEKVIRGHLASLMHCLFLVFS